MRRYPIWNLKHTAPFESLVDVLLANRGLTEADLADSPEVLKDPELMKDMDRLLERVLEAVRKGERITVFGDYVHAEFDRGLGSAKNVPRIPPMSAGFEWRHSHVNWQTKLRLTKVGSQSDLAANETGSDSYYNLNFYTDYHFDLRAGSGLVFLKATNLLDEDIRHHASLLKDLAPAAGRAIEVGLRLEF